MNAITLCGRGVALSPLVIVRTHSLTQVSAAECEMARGLGPVPALCTVPPGLPLARWDDGGADEERSDLTSVPPPPPNPDPDLQPERAWDILGWRLAFARSIERSVQCSSCGYLTHERRPTPQVRAGMGGGWQLPGRDRETGRPLGAGGGRAGSGERASERAHTVHVVVAAAGTSVVCSPMHVP